MSLDLINRLRNNELFNAAIRDLDEEQRAAIASIAEGMLRELEEVIEEANDRPTVLSPGAEQPG